MNPNIIISLVAPCLNEEKNVELLASRFLVASETADVLTEIIFIDDGSTDLTWERIGQLCLRYPGRIIPIRHSKNRGIPQGWISGVDAAKGELICLIDSDLQNPPEAVFEMFEALNKHNVDLVRGVRKPVMAQSRLRVIMSRVLNFVLNFVFEMKLKDNKSGFILGKSDEIKRIVYHSGHYCHYQTFIGVAAHSRGVKSVEIETPFEDRRNGISFLSGRSLKVIKEVLKDLPAAQAEFGSRFRKRKKHEGL
jgi:glycosyltransferase involved in cell wall biosynthesis